MLPNYRASKPGQVVSVWYVWFIHATRDLLADWPAYSIHNCAQSFRAVSPVSICKLQHEEMYAHAQKFQLWSDFQQAKLKKASEHL